MKDVTLPIELASGKYKLEEIGAIFVLFSMLKLSDEEKEWWAGNDDFSDVVSWLIDGGTILVDETDGELNVEISL